MEVRGHTAPPEGSIKGSIRGSHRFPTVIKCFRGVLRKGSNRAKEVNLFSTLVMLIAIIQKTRSRHGPLHNYEGRSRVGEILETVMKNNAMQVTGMMMTVVRMMMTAMAPATLIQLTLPALKVLTVMITSDS